MSLARFEIFSKVVELDSFTKAAEKLNMTQSAVSHAVAGLESEWGITLLIRDRKKGLMLTEVGQKTLIHIREILNQLEKIKQEVSFASNLEAGTIRIGSFASATSCILPKIISKFHKKHPNIEFTFFEGTYAEIIEWFETGVIDIGIVVQQNMNTNLNVLPLIKDKMVVAFPEGHRFQGEITIDIQDLQEEPFIMPKGVYRTHVDEIFSQANIKPLIRFEVQDCATIASMVQEGLGITIGPELFLKDQPKIKLGNLKQLNWRSVALAYPSLQSVSPAVQAFLTVAQDLFTTENESCSN
ncbi:LysR family transcriptional regulator [Paenibacillus baekrokdamisoli]|uniref:LysR family transcriptional regulator n=1 Tax=Paenibacillus baekrokdamisoli TaxID=1712516 RepID=A0A3G9J7C5_9BACL|nr:LysR family transcriptional regulator [Paenibacillus baekrokdamisoli]MBB3069155.1 DNA-binding transcriptional LysR family regulator [Paenibacillus baekrokdamisoli]BBH18869.1 LysR family transcriptional regulator [Paenibacillus baekrokdamisoli]